MTKPDASPPNLELVKDAWLELCDLLEAGPELKRDERHTPPLEGPKAWQEIAQARWPQAFFLSPYLDDKSMVTVGDHHVVTMRDGSLGLSTHTPDEEGVTWLLEDALQWMIRFRELSLQNCEGKSPGSLVQWLRAHEVEELESLGKVIGSTERPGVRVRLHDMLQSNLTYCTKANLHSFKPDESKRKKRQSGAVLSGLIGVLFAGGVGVAAIGGGSEGLALLAGISCLIAIYLARKSWKRAGEPTSVERRQIADYERAKRLLGAKVHEGRDQAYR